MANLGPKLIAFVLLALPISVGLYVARDVYLSSGNQINVPGHRAAKRLAGIWPADVSPSAVSGVYVDAEESMDTAHSFIRLRCDRQTAAAWSKSFEARWKRRCSFLLSIPDYDVATQQSKIHDIDPYVSTPSWWSPHDLESVDALETCRWHKNDRRDRGWSSGIYSGYNPELQLFWIYEFYEQHPGILPRLAIVEADLHKELGELNSQ